MRARDEIEDNNWNDDAGRPLGNLEDMHGMRCCLHCINCVLKKQSTIFSDGKWFCFHKKEWRNGDDLFEYCCAGFKQKECSNCGNRNVCGWYYKNVKSGKHRFCKRAYINRGLRTPGRFIVGRRREYRGDDPVIIEMENKYRIAHGMQTIEDRSGEYEKDSSDYL